MSSLVKGLQINWPYNVDEMKMVGWKNTGHFCGSLEIWENKNYKAYRNPETRVIYNIVKTKKTRSRK